MQGKSGSQYVIYSTEQGKTAADGSGSNSPFTESLVKHMKSPDRVEDVMKKVAIELKTKTNDKQIPGLEARWWRISILPKRCRARKCAYNPGPRAWKSSQAICGITSDLELELLCGQTAYRDRQNGYAFNLPDQPVGELILEFWWENAKYSLKTSIYDNRVTKSGNQFRDPQPDQK
jgi:hypothetical protein